MKGGTDRRDASVNLLPGRGPAFRGSEEEGVRDPASERRGREGGREGGREVGRERERASKVGSDGLMMGGERAKVAGARKRERGARAYLFFSSSPFLLLSWFMYLSRRTKGGTDRRDASVKFCVHPAATHHKGGVIKFN